MKENHNYMHFLTCFLNTLENSLGLDLKAKYACALDVETGQLQLHYVTRKVLAI